MMGALGEQSRCQGKAPHGDFRIDFTEGDAMSAMRWQMEGTRG